VQKDNREDTLVSQDGQYFMDVLRNGRQGTREIDGEALDFLTNYVDTINIKTYSGTNLVYSNLIHEVTYSTPTAQVSGATVQSLTNGHVILGLLSTPQYEPGKRYGLPGSLVRQEVVATVRALSGSATEQNGGNQLVAFKYQLAVTLMPYNMTPWMNNDYTNYPVGNSDLLTQTNQTTVHNQLVYWQNSLIDERLQFSWPVLPNGSTGPNRKYFRTVVSGLLQDISLPNTNNPDLFLYVVNPGVYTTSTNLF
jgi:hypothetical protein